MKETITLNGVEFVWDTESKSLKFYGIDLISFWKKPSLTSILMPLRDEIGPELYYHIVAFEASKGTFEDYHNVIEAASVGLEEGFNEWGRMVSSVGWGESKVISVDHAKKEAVVRIINPWEMTIFGDDHPEFSIPFLSGKISGIFGHAFQTNCRAQVIESKLNEKNCHEVYLKVFPSRESLEEALNKVQSRMGDNPLQQLRISNSALRKSQQHQLDVLEIIGQRVWEVDQQFVCHYVSKIHQKDNVYASEDLIGKSLIEIVFAEDKNKLMEACQRLINNQTGIEDITIRINSVNNDIIWVRLQFKLLRDVSGNHYGYLGSSRNVSNEIALENEVANQRKKSIHSAKMASLGEMASGIAHEINNPLTIIRSNAWYLKDLMTAGELTPETLSTSLDAIEKVANRISDIIKGMRAFSKDADATPKSLCSIKSVLDETLVLCRTRMSNHGVELRINNVDPELKISCRSVQVGQVILNLLNNSFDAIISLKEKWIEVKVIELADAVEIRVIDSGSGIPEDVRSKIMQPFFTTKGPDKGTGLGLAISNGIMNSHKGKFYLDEKAQNTTFVLSFPKSDQ